MADSSLTRIGAIWKKKSKTGNPYYSGKLEIDGKELEIVLFPVKEKKNEKGPDVEIFTRSEGDATKAAAPAAKKQDKPAATKKAAPAPAETEEDLPF